MAKMLFKTNGDALSALADTLKAVAHTERLAIIHLLCSSRTSALEVKSIYKSLNLTQSTTSRHLSMMKKGGLLKREVNKGKTYYSFNLENRAAVCLKEMLEGS
ncbi:MAG TPA: winged helix-turn-helix domain-containing protein [Chryseosolibacter sp.]